MAAPLSRALPAALGLARAPTRLYRAPPLRRGAAPEPREAARRFGRLGEASGVPAGRLWPDAGRLRAEAAAADPPLRDLMRRLRERQREEARREEQRAQLVARSLAAMAARVGAWRRERAAAQERARREAQRRQHLLLGAGFKGLGGPGGTPARAQDLLQDLERQQRRQERRRRRQERQEAARDAMAAAEAAAAARPPPGGEGVSS